MNFKKKLFKYTFLFVLVFITLEFIVRAFFSLSYDSSFFKPSTFLYHYYPMIPDIRVKYAKSDLEAKKILILSSSALTDGWGFFAKHLKESLKDFGNWEVYNAAGVGYSSLDNLNTFKALNDLEFDYIFFYNGINDVRLNNCPPQIFKKDYSHIRWNNEINCILRHKEINYTILPFFIDFSFQKAKQKLFKQRFIPENYHNRIEWLNYGSNFKSIETFKENLTAIIEAKKAETVFLISPFLTYIPENYTFEKFVNKQLDYNYHENSREVEVWGIPKNVSEYMKVLNEGIINEYTVNNHKNINLLMVENALNQGIFFADVCHFSEEGIREFVSEIILKIDKQ